MSITGSSADQHSEAPASLALQMRVMLLCALVAFCDGLDTQAIAFVAPVISGQWGIAPALLGPVFSSGLVGLALGAFLFGPLADRFGRKPVILLCVALFALCSLGTTLAQNIGQLTLWRVVTGLGLGGVLPNLISLTNDYASARLRHVLVMVMFCGFPLGATIGGLVTAPVVAWGGWQGVFYLGGGLPLVLLPVLWLGLPAARQKGKGEAVASAAVGQIFAEGRLVPTLLLWMAFFCNLLVMYFLVNWMPSLLSLVGSSLSLATLSAAILNLGGIFGALALSYLIARFDPLRLLAMAYVSGAVGLMVMGMGGQNVPVLLAASAYVGAVVVGGQIAMNAVTASFYPASVKSTGVGWALGVGRIGSIIGPLLGGALLKLGWQGMAVIKAAIMPMLLAALAVALLRWRQSSKTASA
ncbi:MFS transporter [Novosphingobium umbonatum]|uniref:MFS transporter n=2 Tax=Novosphingobium umbonatum TaxID=1908524 RepID=A0A437N7N7_9SPHN|nr:MFS transporter [Novosphingobium umbonatum]